MAESRRLFGTDGVRGTANIEPMTSETALRLGRALAHVSKRRPHRHKILIGKDTRLSGYMLETAMASGICSAGVDVLLVGPLPTPGIAFLTRSLRADAGVVISASHNPFQDNGIKLFSRSGFKLPDDVEAEIEALVLGDSIDALRPTREEIGKAYRIDDAIGRYNVFAKLTFPRHLTLDDLTVALDCAHGAAYKVAPEVFEELGARVIARGVEPDGHNINRDAGALHPEQLQALVRSTGAHVGIALDGDADRAILVDEQGEVVDGDAVMALLATQLRERDQLRQGTLVATVMSNLGLHVAMRDRGINVVTTPVGDRYVVEEMLRGGFNLGRRTVGPRRLPRPQHHGRWPHYGPGGAGPHDGDGAAAVRAAPRDAAFSAGARESARAQQSGPEDTARGREGHPTRRGGAGRSGPGTRPVLGHRAAPAGDGRG